MRAFPAPHIPKHRRKLIVYSNGLAEILATGREEKSTWYINLLGVSSPPGKEQRQTDSLKDTGESTNSNGIERSLLSDDLGDELFKQLAHIHIPKPHFHILNIPKEQS
jgi:hypothetical protein